jgi:hypothetical protein
VSFRETNLGDFAAILGCESMGFLSLYLDESGHSASMPLVVVAGFMGRVSAWRGFAKSWNRVLRKHGVTPPFHMTEFSAKSYQFEGWDETKQSRPLMAALMREVTTRSIVMLGAAMTVESFKQIDWSVYPEFEPLEDVYHLVMQDVIRLALSVSSDPHPNAAPYSGDKLAVVIAKQPEYGAHAASYYHATAALSDDTRLVNAAVFADQIEFPQLQAADIAAFELRRKIARPDLNRYPWAEMEKVRQICLYVRGVDVGTTFPTFPIAEGFPEELTLKEKRTATKGRVL